MSASKYYHPFVLALITIFLSLFFWLIFYFHLPQQIGYGPTSLETIFFNYDGPNYMVISHCWYDPSCIASRFSLPQPIEYYPAHLPGFPLVIWLFSLIVPGPKAMLSATLVGSIFLVISFYYLLRLYTGPSKSFWLSLILLFIPARLFVLRQIGAPESFFIALTLTSIINFKNKRYWSAAIFAALAQSFKSPGILLFGAYGLLLINDQIKGKNITKYLPMALVPAAVLAIFGFYYLQTGDFWAYFHSGDNFHLNALPYLTFISSRSWIGSIWLEDIVYVYLLALYGVSLLLKKYKWDIIAVYPALFLLATIFVAHRDISRYATPLYPFLLLAFRRHLSSPIFRIVLLLIIPAVFLYAINFVAGNIAPVADWAPYL